jgi:hypothetical protein
MRLFSGRWWRARGGGGGRLRWGWQDGGANSLNYCTTRVAACYKSLLNATAGYLKSSHTTNNKCHFIGVFYYATAGYLINSKRIWKRSWPVLGNAIAVTVNDGGGLYACHIVQSVGSHKYHFKFSRRWLWRMTSSGIRNSSSYLTGDT